MFAVKTQIVKDEVSEKDENSATANNFLKVQVS